MWKGHHVRALSSPVSLTDKWPRSSPTQCLPASNSHVYRMDYICNPCVKVEAKSTILSELHFTIGHVFKGRQLTSAMYRGSHKIDSFRYLHRKLCSPSILYLNYVPINSDDERQFIYLKLRSTILSLVRVSAQKRGITSFPPTQPKAIVYYYNIITPLDQL